MSIISRFILSLFLLSVLSCSEQPAAAESPTAVADDFASLNAIFPKGERGPAENFTGAAFNTGLVALDSTYTMVVGNVYFEPGARSNWHIHPAGQILLITDGEGYHQLEGQPRQRLKRGDVIKCPPNVRHWHGAAPETGMQQLYLLPNAENGIVEWQEAVTDAVYRGEAAD